MPEQTFIIDCPWCKAKVAAIEKGVAERSGFEDEMQEPYGQRVSIGQCPRCQSLLVGESHQIGFSGWDSENDEWSDVTRVYPKPPKTFSSLRIPRVVTDSLIEADRSLIGNANIAACMMLGRALEAVCRDILLKESSSTSSEAKKVPKKNIMLLEGIKKLKETHIIDDRLYDWSQQLHAFRNLAAHPEDIQISRRDAEDLQIFVYAIVEYIYDLTDRYNQFKNRVEKTTKRKKS